MALNNGRSLISLALSCGMPLALPRWARYPGALDGNFAPFGRRAGLRTVVHGLPYNV
jgi:hypothetical protein